MKTIVMHLVLALLVVCSSYSQNNEKPLIKKFSVKGSVEMSNYSVTSFEKIPNGHKSWVLNFGGAVNYDYSDKISFEAEYRYLAEQVYSDFQNSSVKTDGQGDSYYYYGHSGIRSHVLNLKANFFLSEKKNVNPVYFIGGVSLASQPVTNVEDRQYWDDYGHQIKQVYIETKYSRLLAGPMAGVGVYFNFGFISFTSEFSFSSRIALGKDKKFTESSFNMSFSPIIRL